MRLSVLDLDGSLTWQAPIWDRIAAGQADVVDLRNLCRALRLWAWDGDFARFAARLPAFGGDGPSVVMIGSGEYHHLTAALLERVGVPITVVHLDNHPDWAWTFPRRHCGSWVDEALDLPMVARVVTLGCCSQDLARPDRRGANLRALRSGKLAMLPWLVAETPLGRRARPLPGHDVRENAIHWRMLGRILPASHPRTSRRQRSPPKRSGPRSTRMFLPRETRPPTGTRAPCPSPSSKRCWRGLPRATASRASTSAATTRRHGHRNAMKWTEALLDQPRRPPPSLAVNEATNERLLSLLERVL